MNKHYLNDRVSLETYVKILHVWLLAQNQFYTAIITFIHLKSIVVSIILL